MRRAIVVVLLLLLAVPSAHSQQIPPRDARPAAQSGTAAVRGRVFAADSKRPLRRARITLTAPELGMPRSTSTSLDGRYEFRDLPAGRYTLTVGRNGYLQLSHGQSRPFEQGRPLQLEAGQVMPDVDFTLPRMSLITGRIVDETGDPVSGVRVYPMRAMFFEGRRQLVPVAGQILTNDIGEYRILGLSPGTYYVVADLRETWTVSDNGVDRVMGYAPTYYPGVPNLADARRVTVEVGQQADGIDFPLIPARAASLSGMAFDSLGRPLAGRRITMAQEVRGPAFASFSGVNPPNGLPTVGADGSFRVRDLAPGEYKLRITAPVLIGDSTVEEGASATVIIADGVDVDNIVLTTTPGWSIAGTVISDTGQPPALARDRITLSAQLEDLDLSRVTVGSAGPENGRVRDDWSYSVGNVIGRTRLRVTVPDGWRVKAVLREGGDVTDDWLESRSGRTLADLQVVITDQVNTVTGQLTDERGRPSDSGTVLIFATDAQKWAAQDSRHVRAARPDQQGQYRIRGLPAGEYFAIALDYVEQGSWNDPDFLESLREAAQRFTIDEVGIASLALRVSTR